MNYYKIMTHITYLNREGGVGATRAPPVYILVFIKLMTGDNYINSRGKGC